MWSKDIEAILAVLDNVHRDELSNARALALGLAEVLKSCWRTETMTQALIDAVTAVANNVQALTDSITANEAAQGQLIAALQAAINANPGAVADPDIARAIDALAAPTAQLAADATKINADTQTMLAAVAPPAATTTAAPAAPAASPSS